MPMGEKSQVKTAIKVDKKFNDKGNIINWFFNNINSAIDTLFFSKWEMLDYCIKIQILITKKQILKAYFTLIP